MPVSRLHETLPSPVPVYPLIPSLLPSEEGLQVNALTRHYCLHGPMYLPVWFVVMVMGFPSCVVVTVLVIEKVVPP